MQHSPAIALFLISLILCIFCFNPAHAATIVNLDDKPQALEVEVAGGFQTVMIAAGATWRIPGKVKIRYHGRELFMDDSDEYAMWKNGDFGPQRHIGHEAGSADR